MPGLISSSLLVFIPTVGDYVTPTLVGGPSGIMVGNAIQTLFYRVNNIPLGSALSLVMMLVVTLLVCLFLWSVGYRKMQQRADLIMRMKLDPDDGLWLCASSSSSMRRCC